ncbi:MAG: methylenetetrahydrofolate reductase [NAD(P)H] [Desulfomonilia bacterium]|jgi:methylenetetrahydrofolate reductase (NADPH)|uniref:methylenetetrahydrofolate reductase (NADH) n=1 Tax=anaerobic digester metagenome TaxID=1263854 RepID=A0A485M127_9ZZZZ|nr:methylenetetrahydrofolate reductase [NAD(P)H] [Pseudomonadota bacterium]HPD21030.1 methylenetetrahydrofolate reductase [NAD(P)H] [Deltaproteobacteria bacterium]HPX17405.1 methylenetetrahydrofolate reductase [NAD(P)H] [Deltaproteobacteria bacterium]HRS55317.1 methylenetetrahydrofolate reductase [NAD(P)H] [Desulfomonilia bacterium]HRV35566.1 methylenetetrahydrofolate reductase [NAD(P)H] [Desulfomonilia bacterium]
MLVREILKEKKTSFSFEFFPPKTPGGWDKLFLTISDLIPLKPSWVSVTYGAGGSTRENTHNLVVRIKKETDLTVVTHLTCIEATRGDIMAILERYDSEGIYNILALRGDPPLGQSSWEAGPEGFCYAIDLVAFIKKHFPHMCVGVAGFPEGHPETKNRLQEIEHLKAKVDAGADYIITQLFFDNRDYYDFCERCELAGITVPIIAGIMPVISRSGMIRMAELAARARIPAALLKSVQRAGSDESVERVGIHWATEQVRDLIDNHARGIHFYTLNNANATLKIYEALGVDDSSQLA